MTNTIELCDWKVHWRLTESAGIAIYLANYKGRRVLWEGSLPFVVVDHQAQNIAENDGARTHGPFWVPLGARTLAEPVRTNEFRGGFELAADFVAGPYRYTQLWRFHDDGRIGPWLTIYGNGVHDSHTYHPHWRFDFDIDGSQHDTLQVREGDAWTDIISEGWFPASSDSTGSEPQWRQIDEGTKAVVTIRPHHREDAELYALRYNDGEWPPFTPHGPGGQSFPAAFVGEEPIENEDVTLWYVGHIHYDNAFPFTAGPWLQVKK